jgi:hypothetical protein
VAENRPVAFDECIHCRTKLEMRKIAMGDDFVEQWQFGGLVGHGLLK